jgi:hypothetical protein
MFFSLWGGKWWARFVLFGPWAFPAHALKTHGQQKALMVATAYWVGGADHCNTFAFWVTGGSLPACTA